MNVRFVTSKERKKQELGNDEKKNKKTKKNKWQKQQQKTKSVEIIIWLISF